MPNNDMINKAADKAYERHSQDNTGLALKPKMTKAPTAEELQELKDAGLPVPKATEIKKEEEDKTVAGVLREAAATKPTPVAQQVDTQAQVDMMPDTTGADLFTLYNL